MTMSKLRFPDPAHPVYMNWRPADSREAFSIMDWGGPLVESTTGRVIVLATLPPELWTNFVTLPEGATLEGVPVADQPAANQDPEAKQDAPSAIMRAKAAWRATQRRELVAA